MVVKRAFVVALVVFFGVALVSAGLFSDVFSPAQATTTATRDVAVLENSLERSATTTTQPATSPETITLSPTTEDDVQIEEVTCVDSDYLDFLSKGRTTYNNKQYYDYCRDGELHEYFCTTDVADSGGSVFNPSAFVIRSLGQVIGVDEPESRTKDCSDFGETFVCSDGACVDASECALGEKRSCGTDVGVCSMGFEYCSGGLWSGVCEEEVAASPEVCDSLDNDCDGVADDGLRCDEGGSDTTDPPPEGEVITCYDSDGTNNFWESGWTAYLDAGEFPGVVTARPWPNPSRDTIYQDYCKYNEETGEADIAVDYHCNVVSDLVDPETGSKNLLGRVIDGLDGERRAAGDLASTEDIRPRGDAYTTTQVCAQGCYLGRCLTRPVEVSLVPEGMYIWNSPITLEGVARVSCFAFSYEHGVDSMVVDITAKNEQGVNVVSFSQEYDTQELEAYTVDEAYSDKDIDNFFNAFPGEWTFTCTAQATNDDGEEYTDIASVTLQTDDCRQSFCPPSQHFSVFPVYDGIAGGDTFMIEYEAHANSEELKTLKIVVERKQSELSSWETYQSDWISCDQGRCTYFGLANGVAYEWRVTTVLYDFSGKSYVQTRTYGGGQ